MKLTKQHKYIITMAFSMISVISFAQTTGSFKGKIIEQSTKQPVIGASVYIDNLQLGAATDTSGICTISNIPIGTYAVTVSSIGFQIKKISEITIKVTLN